MAATDYTTQITNAYKAILRASPTTTQISDWNTTLNGGVTTVSNMISSLQNTSDGLITQQVTRLYQSAFNRAPDSSGLDYWFAQIKTNGIDAVGKAFLSSAEAVALYGSPSSNTTAYVTQLYTSVLGRTPTSSELSYYTTGAGNTNTWTTLTHFSEAQEAISLNATAMSTFLNAAAGGSTSVYTTSTTKATFSTVAATGTTYNLTSGIDTGTAFTATSGTNTFFASTDGFLTADDSLTGGSGTDTLMVRALASNTGAFTSTGIETIDVRTAAAGGTVNLSNASGYTKLIANADAGALIFTNIAASNTLALQVSDTSTGAANATFTYKASAFSGSADTVNLTLSNNSGAINVSIDDGTAGTSIETLAITAGTASTGVVTIAGTDALAAAKVTVVGSGALILAGALTGATFDASTDTGGVTAVFGVANQTITGGTGNDSFDMSTGYTTADTVAGGTGTDTLILTATQATTTATQSNVSSIEIIQVGGGATAGAQGASTIDLTKWGATGYSLGAVETGDFTITAATGTDSLALNTFGANQAIGFTVNGSSTSDVVNVTIGSTAAGNVVQAGTITFTGAETVNITAQGGADTLGAVVLTATAAVETLKVLGSQTLTLGAVTADVIDAGSSTGSLVMTAGSTAAGNGLTITGSAQADTLFGAATASTISGGAGNDTINGGAAADILSGGDGNDTIANRLTAGNASAADNITGGLGNDTYILRGDVASGAAVATYATASRITDFSVSGTNGTDVLQISATSANYSGTGSAGAIVGGGAVAAGSSVITSIATATGTAVATDATADLIKLTTGLAVAGTIQAAFDSAIGANTVTGYTNNNDYVFVSLYDTTNGVMDVLEVQIANKTLAAADVVTLVGTITMSATDYAAFGSSNFSIIGA